MERSTDIRKRYPLLVVGSQPLPGLEGEARARLEGADWPGRFLCLSGPTEEIRDRLHEASALGIPNEQILIAAAGLPFPPPPGTALLERHPEEGADDLRHRLAQKLESLRQRKLPCELGRIEQSGALASLAPADAAAARDRARFAHALACAYELGPDRHGMAIRLAAGLGQPDEAPWSSSIPPERLLALGAALALGHGQSPAGFRDRFRERSALLPFRVRNELKSHLEKILEPLWGGRHAA